MTAYGGGSRESRVEIIDNIGKDNEVKAKKEKRPPKRPGASEEALQESPIAQLVRALH